MNIKIKINWKGIKENVDIEIKILRIGKEKGCRIKETTNINIKINWKREGRRKDKHRLWRLNTN